MQHMQHVSLSLKLSALILLLLPTLAASLHLSHQPISPQPSPSATQPLSSSAPQPLSRSSTFAAEPDAADSRLFSHQRTLSWAPAEPSTQHSALSTQYSALSTESAQASQLLSPSARDLQLQRLRGGFGSKDAASSATPSTLASASHEHSLAMELLSAGAIGFGVVYPLIFGGSYQSAVTVLWVTAAIASIQFAPYFFIVFWQPFSHRFAKLELNMLRSVIATKMVHFAYVAYVWFKFPGKIDPNDPPVKLFFMGAAGYMCLLFTRASESFDPSSAGMPTKAAMAFAHFIIWFDYFLSYVFRAMQGFEGKKYYHHFLLGGVYSILGIGGYAALPAARVAGVL